MLVMNKQKGLTTLSVMFWIAVLSFVAVIAVKITPVYLDSYKVADIVSSLKDERGLGDRSNREITNMIVKRLEVNLISDVSKNDILIEKVKNEVYVDVEYEVRRHLFSNLDVVMSFKKSVEASGL